jgi:hypothetical protein
MKGVTALVIAASVGLAAPLAAQGGRGGGPATPVDLTVPSALRPLLAPHRSEMRLVAVRYTADRQLLTTNYAGTGGNRGGRGGRAGGRGAGPILGGQQADSAAAAAAADSITASGRGGPSAMGEGRGGGRGRADSTVTPPTTVSVARIARLKRFDLSWQSALDAVDRAKLTPAAKLGLDSLKQLVARNLAQLDTEAATLASVAPLMPFAPTLVSLVESRIRIEPIDGEAAAATLTQVTKDVAGMKTRLEDGLNGADGAVHVSAAQATAAVSALISLRNNLGYWFDFFDGYDPTFSWWNRRPFAKADSTLLAYTTFLREKIVPANKTSTLTGPALRIDPAPPPKYGEVPNVNEILALPQDEMADIVQRFRAGLNANPGRGGGRGAVGGGNQGRGNQGGIQQDAIQQGGGGRGGFTAGPLRDSAWYNGWLAALKTVNFDKLTRNAQVDYLYMKKRAELDLARIGRPLAPADSNPRKADKTGIPGRARGREGLIRDLQDELIPYSPEELLVLAEREFAWHDAEMLKASREMGFGDDWKAALEKTKTMHPPPGGQPQMIKDLIFEAIDYIRENDLLTMPEVNVESQHMIMMTPERQLVNPFFTGGGQMSVSFPTDAMEFDARQQSMRGNNRPWSHATAFHEMIPGHNLVNYYGQRYGSNYRPSLGGGPFYGEGWAVYWELIMYEKGFHDTPEERVGALFWRMHRCARIIFSLKFHLGQWSPQEAIDFLVDRVGHERENATAEVRRSFEGGYGPLYQAAYLLGAIQLRGLRRELVDSGIMTEKAFHDEILRQGSMPITLLRLALTKQKLTRDMNIDWKFYGDLPTR